MKLPPMPGLSAGLGVGLGEAVLARSRKNKRRHPKFPQRVLFPRFFGVLGWVLIALWTLVAGISWITSDENSVPSPLAMTLAFSLFGLAGVVTLLFYHNTYVENYEDHVVYRTWLRRVHRVNYTDILAYRIARGTYFPAGVRVWTTGGKRKYFQLPVFGMDELLNYVEEHEIEQRFKHPVMEFLT